MQQLFKNTNIQIKLTENLEKQLYLCYDTIQVHIKNNNKGQHKYITSYREPKLGESLVRYRIYLLSPFSYLIEI